MDHALQVRIIERVGGSGDDIENIVDRKELSFGGEVFQVGTVQQFHGDIADIPVVACVVDGNDVGVDEPPGRLSFTEEAFLHRLHVGGIKFVFESKGLNGDFAVDLR